MLSQTLPIMPHQPSQSLGAFGMGMAVGFSAGIALKIFLPGVTSIAEAILNKLGFEMGDVFISLWNPEQRSAAPLQLQPSRRGPREKARPKMTINPPKRGASSKRGSEKKERPTPKNGRSVKPTGSFSSKRVRPLAPMKMKVGMN